MNQPSVSERDRANHSLSVVALCALLLLGGCRPGKSPSPLAYFPDADAFPTWRADADAQIYDRETLFDLVDGQADFFFVYGFEQVATRRYKNAEGRVLEVQIWQLADPEDAYGLFTASIAGEPVAVGNEGDADPGRRLSFWQDRYVVQVFTRAPIPDADLRAFAEAVSETLPAGGERPALVGRLPPDGLVARGFIFFHAELSIQDRLWLGGENLLGLSQATDGVLAQYDLGDTPTQLLLVEYPDAAQATTGLAALQGGDIDGLLAADVRGNLLGAVFGETDATAARELLNRALQ